MRAMSRSLLVLAVLIGVACGDDDGEGATGGSGGSAGTGGSGGSAGTGGSGGSAGTGGSGGSVDAGLDADVDAAMDAATASDGGLDATADATTADGGVDANLDADIADASDSVDASDASDSVDASDAAVIEQPIVESSCGVNSTLADALTDTNVALGVNMRWLYPYDGTVFPSGLPSPTLQWEGGPTARAALLRVRSALLDVETCLTVAEAGRLRVPQRIWNLAASQSRGKDDPTSIELVVTDNAGDARRILARSVIFASGPLNDVVYYNTYGSSIANQAGITGSVVMRAQPDASDPELFLTSATNNNCVSCHSVSAHGTRVVTLENVQPGLVEGPGQTYALTSRATRPSPASISTPLIGTGYSAVYPDGSILLTSGRSQNGPIGRPHLTGTFGPETSRLIDAATGTTINASGIPSYALMPAFSPSGALVAFNRVAGTSDTDGHTLSVMDFDRASNTFSNTRTLYTDASLYPGWPTFLPSVSASNESDLLFAGRARVVFAVGDQADFGTQNITLLPPFIAVPHLSDLWWIDVESGMTAPLRRVGGFDGNDCYLPDCTGAHRDFMPFVSPYASGGYFWVYFVSRRSYGNLFPTEPTSDAGKRIWAAAIDIDAAPGTDPSHPAFVFPQQEMDAGNIRPVAARAVCLSDGNACTTGMDCCNGYCINGTCGVPSEPTCSALGETCDVAADCCNPRDQACITGFCSDVTP